MRRLFSTFAYGWPGVGLLLMRTVLSIAMIERDIVTLWSRPSLTISVISIVTAVAGVLLLAGLWTPVTGMVVALLEVSETFLHCDDPLICILFATLSAALALLGPGAWSVDARLFGWKRLNIRSRQK